VIYSKHEVIAMPGLPISPIGGAPPLPKSALDPGSLKKAKDRVEKRLRNRLAPRPDQNVHHAQPLDPARKPTTQPEYKPDKREIRVLRAVAVKTTPKDQNDLCKSTADQTDAPITNPSNHSTPDLQAAKSNDLPESKPAFDPIDDVQKKTVVLETAAQLRPETTFTATEADRTDMEDTPRMPKGLDLPPAYIAHGAPTAETNQFGDGLRRLLPIVAWLILFSGVVGAVLSWTTISSVEAGMNISHIDDTGPLPLGLLLGFAYLATGALGFAFFWVSFTINGQLKDIHQLLLTPPGSHTPQAPAADLPDKYEEMS
jgi:hypothetical protein